LISPGKKQKSVSVVLLDILKNNKRKDESKKKVICNERFNLKFFVEGRKPGSCRADTKLGLPCKNHASMGNQYKMVALPLTYREFVFCFDNFLAN
jgi:hypothetical protein